LSISTLAPLDYYLDEERTEKYADDTNVDIRYTGLLAMELGLKTRMKRSKLCNVYSGCTASCEELLVNSGPAHKSGLDFTFSAPKPVSVAWARADESLRDKITAAHRFALVESISFLEEKAGKTIEKARGFAVTIFDHYTSRSDDVQLHSTLDHCLNIKLQQVRSIGRRLL
jgi:conjugative relaxase-like TrwC/TraI family protein